MKAGRIQRLNAVYWYGSNRNYYSSKNCLVILSSRTENEMSDKDRLEVEERK